MTQLILIEAALEAQGLPSDALDAAKHALHTLLADRGSSAINVKSRGAIGDGAADDTAALQGAIDAAVQNKKPLNVPAGRYKTGPLVVSGDLTVQGDGTRVTELVAAQQEQTTMLVQTGGNVRFELSDVRFVGGRTQLRMAGSGVLLRDSRIRSAEFISFAECGMDFGALAIGTTHSNINMNGGNNSPYQTCGVRSVGQTYLHYASFHNLRVTNCNTAVWIEDTSPPGQGAGQLGVAFYQPILEGNKGRGMFLHGAGANVYNAYFEHNGGPDIEMTTNYAGGAVNKSWCKLYTPTFDAPHASQSDGPAFTRVKIGSHFCELSVYDAHLAAGRTHQVDAVGYYSAAVRLVNSPFAVKTSPVNLTSVQRQEAGVLLAGKRATSGTSWLDTGVGVNAGHYGGVALLLCSRHVPGGVSEGGLYMLTRGYSDDTYSIAKLNGPDLAEFSVAPGGSLLARSADGTNIGVTVIGS